MSTATGNQPLPGGEFSPDPAKPLPYPELGDPPSAYREWLDSKYER